MRVRMLEDQRVTLTFPRVEGAERYSVYAESQKFVWKQPEAVWQLMNELGTDMSACGHWEQDYVHITDVSAQWQDAK